MSKCKGYSLLYSPEYLVLIKDSKLETPDMWVTGGILDTSITSFINNKIDRRCTKSIAVKK
jgi:hypothetical protein